MHYHPLIREVDLTSIGIWEAEGEIVGVVHPEHAMGTAYLQIHPEWDTLKGDMLVYAEDYVSASVDGGRHLRVHIGEEDVRFQELASHMGYVRGEGCEEMSHFDIPDPFPDIVLRKGFRLTTLAEENDLRKVNRVLWRGFNHGDEPPDDGIEDREFMQSAPNYRRDLNVVVVGPDGNFVSYCGMWYEPAHSIAYVEPVATDPDYRRMGLGRAAVLEGIRRSGRLGARTACVGTTKPFYLSFGFRRVHGSPAWEREWA
jgi:predicted N-acetyltransferase YhbS